MQNTERRKAVVLLSGGLDSTTVLAIAQSESYDVYALSFRYGQRHHIEIDRAKRVAERFKAIRHVIQNIDLGIFGGSALTADIDVPKDRPMSDESDIPITYVPARNTIFLSFALAFAETIGAYNIFLGINAVDYSGYPDCRPEFLEAFEKMSNLATKAGVEGQKMSLHAPLLHMTKAQIIQRGLDLGVDYSITSSCYDPGPNGEACGHCDSCQLRLAGFAQVGATDPIIYQN